MTIHAIQKMPVLYLGLEEKDEQFWAMLKFPDKESTSDNHLLTQSKAQPWFFRTLYNDVKDYHQFKRIILKVHE